MYLLQCLCERVNKFMPFSLKFSLERGMIGFCSKIVFEVVEEPTILSQ
jgi:hypothetical protein